MYTFTAPISVFVDEVQARADRLVIDETGLSGLFERLDDVRPPDIGVTNGTASLPSSDLPLRLDRYGLRLESAKAMVDVIVIDYAEKPSEN